MTVQHSSLAGNDLHAAKIALTTPQRVPAHVGELTYYEQVLWVATSTDQAGWMPAMPVAFSWLVDTSEYQIPQGWILSKASLFYFETTATGANDHAAEFALVHTWEAGIDWKAGSPINLNDQIQLQGSGCYALLLSGDDAYGGVNQPMPGQQLQSGFIFPASAVTAFQFTSDFAGLGGNFYQNVVGFEISELLTQAVFKVINV